MSINRRGSRPKYEAEHGARYCRDNKLCAECGTGLEGRRTRWCSDECVNEYLIRSDPAHARKMVYRRDRGVCAQCGTDCDEIRSKVRKSDKRTTEEYLSYLRSKGVYKTYCWPRPGGYFQERNPRPDSYASMAKEARIDLLEPYGMHLWWYRKTFWDADHIKAVFEGGGGCELDGLQTLCVKCHRDRTVKQAKRRAGRKVKPKPRRSRERCVNRENSCKLGIPESLCGGCLRYRCRVRGFDFTSELRRLHGKKRE